MTALLVLTINGAVPSASGSESHDDERSAAKSEPVNTPAQRAKIKQARSQRPVPPKRCPYTQADYPAPLETRACLRHDGGGKKVLVVGDSHAEHWVPALYRVAQNRGWRLYSLTRAKCNPLNFIAVRRSDRGHPTVGEACTNWKRRGAYAAVIKSVDPALVLFGGRSQIYDLKWQSGSPVIRRGNPRYFSAWKQSFRGTIKVLTAGGAKVGALTLQPSMRYHVPNCLAQKGFTSKGCDIRMTADPVTRRANQWIKNIHSIYPKVKPVPVNDLLCPGLRCTAVQNGRITHSDLSHITSQWSRAKGVAIFTMLVNKGLL